MGLDECTLPNQAVAGKRGPAYIPAGNTGASSALEYRAVLTNCNLIPAFACHKRRIGFEAVNYSRAIICALTTT